MPCQFTSDCVQGRRCKTPITCSGFPADEEIERFRRERPPVPLKFKPRVVEGAPAEPIRREDAVARGFQVFLLLLAAGCGAAFIHTFFR